MPRICACCASSDPAARRRLARRRSRRLARRRGARAFAFDRRQPRLQRLDPRRAGRRLAQQRLVNRNRLRLVAVLLGREPEIEARRRQPRLFGERLVERRARVRGDHPARRPDQRFAVIGALRRPFALDPQDLAKSARRVVEASQVHVDRRDRRPALGVVGRGGQMRFHSRDRRLHPVGRLDVRHPPGERRVGDVRAPQIGVKAQRHQGNDDQDQRRGDASRHHAFAIRALFRRRRARRDQPPRRLGARPGRFPGRQLPALDVAIDLAELRLVESRFARGAGIALATKRQRPQRAQHRQACHSGKNEP